MTNMSFIDNCAEQNSFPDKEDGGQGIDLYLVGEEENNKDKAGIDIVCMINHSF